MLASMEIHFSLNIKVVSGERYREKALMQTKIMNLTTVLQY